MVITIQSGLPPEPLYWQQPMHVRVRLPAPFPHLCVYMQGSCFYRNASDDTYDFWVKVPGLARRNGNCYCYALDQFRGEGLPLLSSSHVPVPHQLPLA